MNARYFNTLKSVNEIIIPGIGRGWHFHIINIIRKSIQQNSVGIREKLSTKIGTKVDSLNLMTNG